MSNYLWKAASANEDRKHHRFKCNAVVRVVFKRSVAHPIVSLRAVIVNISQGGARLRIPTKDVPDYFYLVVGQFEYGIGCVMVRMEGGEFAVEFIKEQPRRIVEAFALLSFPMAPYFSLQGLLKNDVILLTPSDARSRGI